MLYLSNAIASGMLPEGTLRKQYLTLEDAKKVVRVHEFKSVVGHQNTADLFSSTLEFPIHMNRVNISLFPGDEILVGEYSGPRLPEGATSLPEGAVIRWAIYSIA